jgi:LysM repeat protein
MNGIDCATKLTAATAAKLKAAGIGAVGRYLGRTSWKGLTAEEVRVILAAGLSIFPIWETNPTSRGYFSQAKGEADAKAAIAELAAIGAPAGIAVYFAVDYDAQAADMAAISAYFTCVKAGLAGKYAVGTYGSYGVLTTLEKTGYVTRYYQTYAWSKGKVFSKNTVYQHQNGVSLCGITVDKDLISSTSGLWAPAAKPAPATPSRSEPTPAAKPTSSFTYSVKAGDTLSEIAARYKTTVAKIASLNNIKNPNFIRVGQKLKIAGSAPVAKPAVEPVSSSTHYTVRPGDTLSEIAAKYKTTVDRLVKLNSIKNRNLIYVGQRLRVK